MQILPPTRWWLRKEEWNLFKALYLVTLNHYTLHNNLNPPPPPPHSPMIILHSIHWDGLFTTSQQLHRWLTDYLPPESDIVLLWSPFLYQMFWVEFGHQIQPSSYCKGNSETDGDVWYISGRKKHVKNINLVFSIGKSCFCLCVFKKNKNSIKNYLFLGINKTWLRSQTHNSKIGGAGSAADKYKYICGL